MNELNSNSINPSRQVKITADSTCDLSDAVLEKYDIDLIPLYVALGNKSYRDKFEISPDDLYDYVRKTGKLPKTSAVTVKDYLDRFLPYKLAGRSILHFTISSSMSACYQNAVIAAEELGNVRVIDTANLSTGIGHLAVRAAELAASGLDADHIARAVTELIPKVETSFVIDTLSYLHKGGRCSAVAALGANLLSLKPCIEVRDGAMKVGKKYRGTLEKCLTSYVSDRLQGRADIDLRRIFVTHSKLSPRVTESILKQIGRLAKFEEVIETEANSTVCTHCGPGTLGIIYMKK
ncbi:Fatty acid-binding protein [Caprobacter fermentans]|uniref:Fatty acid-binding protein n=1 Tax=Caproicibacter fermentans TaxID=2576756 RepID=A0A6N8I3Q0_9FIRM|nr:DegV family protein [Caproicibacter fermentans]MVB12588.1 Fatty acid-binding protein [Caproicibacter fermentans]